MKRGIIIFTIVLTVSCVVYYCVDTNKNISEKMWGLYSELVERETIISDMQEIQSYQIKSECRNLGRDIRYKLPSNLYIVRLHDDICLDCYAECLVRLKNELKDDTKLFILGSYHFSTTFKDILMSLNLDSVKYENIPDTFILPADSINRPYVFSLDEYGCTHNVFIFSRKEYDTIKEYVNLIKRKKQDNEN